MGFVAAKIMRYEGVCVMRGMCYEGVDCTSRCLQVRHICASEIQILCISRRPKVAALKSGAP